MRKHLCIVLILLICFVTTISFADEEKKDTKDLQTQRNEIQSELNQANEQLNSIQSDLSENLQQIEKLDSKIEKAENELKEHESKITELKNNINIIQLELDEVSAKHKMQKDLFEKRMIAIYEAGEIQYLDILLKSRNLTEFLSSYYVMSEVVELDINLMNDLAEKKQIINTAKQKLENEKKELSKIVENQIRITNTLENTRRMRQSFISKLSEDEKNLQSKIDEMNEQYKIVNNQILLLAQEGLDIEYIGGELAWPVPGYTRITSPYSMRVHPITGQYKLHTGVDISAPMGANFIAVNDGIVTKAEMNGAYGNMVIVDHGGGVSTLYAHGSEILVTVGQSVKRGDAVLKVGSTGYSTGPHAHFEVRINGVATDPLPYITKGAIPGEEVKEESNDNVN